MKTLISSLKIYLVLVLLISILVFGASCKKSIDPDDPDNEICEFPLYPETGSVGDTIRSCHFEVTLHEAEYDPIEYRGPRITVYATIRFVQSRNKKGANIFTDSFMIEDSKGNIYKWDGLGGDDMIQQVTLVGGQEISGKTTIQVAKNASGFVAIFRESEMLERNYRDRIRWKLNF